MKHVVTAAEMRAIDAATIDGVGLPGAVLMENAGRAVAQVVLEELGQVGGPVAVVAGAGNNGGDGHVVARVLRQRGADVAVYLAAPREAVRGDAAVHLGAYEQVGGVVTSIAGPAELSEAQGEIEDAGVVVDALFGTGLGRPVEGHLGLVIETINRAGQRGARVVAVNIPSGLSADDGVALGVAVRPHRTVTMAFLKRALALSPGLDRVGRVDVAEIGIPLELAAAHGIQVAVLEHGDLVGALPRAQASEHKNQRGHLLVVAGSPGKRGAGRLAAMAGLRAGAGLVTLAAAGHDVSAPDPVMTAELDADDPGAGDRLVELAQGKRAVAMGPGMATGAGGRRAGRGRARPARGAAGARRRRAQPPGRRCRAHRGGARAGDPHAAPG